MKSGREKTDFCCFTSFHVPEVNIEELLAASKVLDDLIQLLRKTNLFLSHLYIKTIILPRQAQDKHRENSKKDAVFRTVPVAAAHFIIPIVIIVMKVCRKNGQRPFQVTSEKR
jgi:hypothetical protein